MCPKLLKNLNKFIFENFGERGVASEKVKGVTFVTDGEAALVNALNSCNRNYLWRMLIILCSLMLLLLATKNLKF